jgi:O-succinylbenzoate synthase
MKIYATFIPYKLKFKFEAGTSRGVLTEKFTSFIVLRSEENDTLLGIGECGPLKGLSIDDRPDFEVQLQEVCTRLNKRSWENQDPEDIASSVVPDAFPSIRFGVETALYDLISGGKRRIFDNGFSRSKASIPINGLVWMGSKEFMLEQIDQKLEQGYTCIKMKIGAINFEEECRLLEYIRRRFSSSDITIRVDANGAFTANDALQKLQQLAAYDLHSIEQPVKQGQQELMAHLCKESLLPIALDEELIGVHEPAKKLQLLETIRPQYIILKPTLVGGFRSSREWISLAEQMGIGWWITSALESNIGLNAISQFTANYNISMPQGLGTGQLYHNNIPSPLVIHQGKLHYEPTQPWELSQLLNV